MTNSLIAPSAFTITQAGINAASALGALGMTVEITSFKLGSSFGYTPSIADTSIRGAPVYVAPPKAWNMVSEHSRDIVCVVPATAGPFSYGEIGIFLSDGTLFAIAAWTEIQTKSSSVAGIANALTFHCVLNVGVAAAVIQVIAETAGVIAEVGSSSYVTGPALMPGKPNALIVKESVKGNNSLLLTAANSHQWNVQDYLQELSGTVTAVSNGGLSISSTVFNELSASTVAGNYLVQDLIGNVRIVTSGVTGVAQLTYPISGLAVGDTIILLSRSSTLSDFAALESTVASETKELKDALDTAIGAINGSVSAGNSAMQAELDAAIADMQAKLDADIADMQAKLDAALAAINRLGTTNWTVNQNGQNLDFRYDGATEFTIYPNSDVSITGRYLRDIAQVTQVISMGDCVGTDGDASNLNVVSTGLAVGGYMIGRLGRIGYNYSGDSVVPAGPFIGTNLRPTATYWFSASTSPRDQMVNITVRYLTGSWSVKSMFYLYDGSGALLDSVAGGGDNGYSTYGSIITRTVMVLLPAGQRVGFYVTCQSTWTGDYLYNIGVESLLDLTLSFANWA